MVNTDAKQRELSSDQFDFDPVGEKTAAPPAKLQVAVHCEPKAPNALVCLTSPTYCRNSVVLR